MAGVALLAAPQAAEAQQSKDWLVCGGNSTSFSTCASVFLTVTDPDPANDDKRAVTLRVWNLSGMDGTYAGSVFTKVGFFHEDYQTGGGIEAEAVAGSLAMSGPTHGSPSQWELGSPNNAGGVVLDLAANNGDGVDNGIAAGCDLSLLPAAENAWLNPCYDDGFVHDETANPGSWITLTFDAVGTWDLATTELLIFAQSGEGDDDSLQCITGGSKFNCETVTVPEPTTWLLLATGLGGLGLVRLRRRRETEFDVTA